MNRLVINALLEIVSVGKSVLDRRLGILIHRGIDFVAADIQIVFSQAILVLGFVNDVVDERLILLLRGRRLIVIINHLRLIHFFLRNVALLIHQLEHNSAPLFGQLGIAQRIIAGRSLRHGRKRGDLP
ncbi:hypothetical protein D3C71_1611950 [compost metagenome]